MFGMGKFQSQFNDLTIQKPHRLECDFSQVITFRGKLPKFRIAHISSYLGVGFSKNGEIADSVSSVAPAFLSIN